MLVPRLSAVNSACAGRSANRLDRELWARAVYFAQMLNDEIARFQAASDRSLLVYFGARITIEAHQRVVRLLRLLELKPLDGVVNVHPAYCSVLIDFDALKISHDELEALLRRHLAALDEIDVPEARLVEIPVCYTGDFGPDLNDVARAHKITSDQLIELHSSPIYTVYFLGFVPGFAYLDGLPERLATARLATPRRSVPRGSVGIAGGQTGIYPFEVPGGWNLIGRTPLEMFRADRVEMSLLAIGDQVRFTAISEERFAALVKT
jgi:KipI family sensor histidine kinase inhibitor